MTTNAGSVRKRGRGMPRHGTESRYRGSRRGSWGPCRCELCTAAYTRAVKRRGLQHLAGVQLLYPAALVAEHIRMLNATGMNNQTIARRSGVSHSTVSYIVHGRSKTCQRENALAILGVRPGDFDERADRPVIGVRRRLQALYAIGHSPETIAAASGMCWQAISQIANGHTRWADQPTETAVITAYALLHRQEGKSDAARRRAQRQGWRDPLWWEDMERIDDPDFDPSTAEKEPNRDELGALRREEIAHLSSYGYDPEVIAERMGLHHSTVRVIVQELRTGVRRDRRQVAA